MWRWNDETTSELRQMWADGLTGTEICQRFQEQRGICPTRCAVMGKIGRLDLAKRRHGSYPPQRATRKEKPPKAIKQPHRHLSIFDRMPQPLPDSPALYGSLPGRLMDLKPQDCRWPVDGAGVDALFCRDQKFENFPYCPTHCRIAYRPANQQRKAA